MTWMLVWWLVGVGHAGVEVTLPSSDAQVEFDDGAQAAIEQGLQALGSGRFDAAGRAFRGLAGAGGGVAARYLEGLSWYEGGQLRLADKALQQVLDAQPGHGPALGLMGLVRADQGRGVEALALLDQAAARAEADGDRRLAARVVLNRGLVRLDQGALDPARDLLTEARSLGVQLDDPALIATADENLGTLNGLTGQGSQGDAMSQVAARLRQGDLAGAREAVPVPPEHDRRAGVRALLADALVDRAEGDLDAANAKLRAALGLAREGGLLRESAAALAELGVLYSLAGRFDMALSQLQEAVGTVAGTSFQLREVAYRVEAGRVAVRLGDLKQARDQLDAASVVAARTQDPLGTARLEELRGQIADRSDQPDAASSQLQAALDVYVQRGHRADAARVATDLVAVWAGRDEAERKRWSKVAKEHFAAVANAAGPAHVEVAAGLGYARRQQLDQALAAFLEAARLAEALGNDRGRQIAAHARENAAQALKALGHTDELAEQMATATELQGVMDRQQAFAAAESAYESALESFNRGEYATAHREFDRAIQAFEKLGETGYASTSRRGRGWAGRNLALRMEPSLALPLFEAAAGDGDQAGDTELRAKAQVGAALAAAELDQKGSVKRLVDAGALAEAAGLLEEAGRCLAEVARVATDLDLRVDAARRAFDLLGNDSSDGTYAMYSVAVDAFNAGAFDVALALADEVAPHAGPLADAVASVRSAASASMSEP